VRVLILGGTGLTGPFAVRRLRDSGHEVTVFHRGQHRAELPDGVRELLGDFADAAPELLRTAPDVVVHMWALTEADALRLVEMFRGVAGRAVVISSGDVYRAFGRLKRAETGLPDPVPLTEDAPLRESRYPYRGMEGVPQDYDKVLVENALRSQRDLPVTILRYPAVFGPNDPYHRFGPWIQQMDGGAAELKLNEGFAQWRWTHGFAEDVAEAVVLAATCEHAAGRTYNVGEAATPTWAERLREWGRVAGWSGRMVTERAEDPLDCAHHLVFDTGRIRRELGYAEVVSPEEAIARTIAWERANAVE
jgi:nucleoside-diphosphate-sugar epimerase